MSHLRLMPLPEDECVSASDLNFSSPVSSTLPTDPGEVLRLVHDLERQAAEATDPLIRRQLLRAGCDLLDNALKGLHLPAA